jgi:REP element-mobilizing transposase RayT
MPKLMTVIVNRYENQSFGYLRVLKNGFRASGSDRAPLAILEFVGNPNDIVYLVYHMAKKQSKKIVEQLKQVEAQKYSLKKFVLRDPVTANDVLKYRQIETKGYVRWQREKETR